jgi:hypothetical protein
LLVAEPEPNVHGEHYVAKCAGSGSGATASWLWSPPGELIVRVLSELIGTFLTPHDQWSRGRADRAGVIRRY